MIKVFLLILMMHSPGMPTVKYQAYVLPTLEACERARIVRENLTNDIAKQRGISPIWVKSQCIEMDMFYQEI
tara:strand:+ start:186 stop:401 length:216 start_codon:yes stop_codon:yes gene_type:complete